MPPRTRIGLVRELPDVHSHALRAEDRISCELKSARPANTARGRAGSSMLSACWKTLPEDPGHWPWDMAQLLVPGPLRASGPLQRSHASWLGLPWQRNTLSPSQAQAPRGTHALPLSLLETAGCKECTGHRRRCFPKHIESLLQLFPDALSP